VKAPAALAALVLAATAACSPVRRHTESVDLRLARGLARAAAGQESIFLSAFPREGPLTEAAYRLLRSKGIKCGGAVSIVDYLYVRPQDAERALAVLRSDPDLARYLLDTEQWRPIDASRAVPASK
jgi:hypothetical protein